jgi:hypothetical protein
MLNNPTMTKRELIKYRLTLKKELINVKQLDNMRRNVQDFLKYNPKLSKKKALELYEADPDIIMGAKYKPVKKRQKN